MQAREPEYGIGEVAVDILRRVKDCAVLGNARIDPEETEIENPAVIDERHDADHGRDEQQGVERPVHGPGKAPARQSPECAGSGGGACRLRHPGER